MRRRYIHHKLGTDIELGKLVSFYGAGLGLFYILLIAQAEDDAIVLEAHPEQLKIDVMPTFQQVTPRDITLWLTALHNHDFIYWDQENNKVYFDPSKFYKYQNDVAESRRRADTDHPKRQFSLPMPKFAADANIWQTIDEVWQLVPKKVQTPWMRQQIRASVEAYPTLAPHEVKLAMLGVLEKFDGKRTDIGFLFANALKWKHEQELGAALGIAALGLVSPKEYSKHYMSMIKESLNATSDVNNQLDKMIQEVEMTDAS